MRRFVTMPQGAEVLGRKLLGAGGQGEVWLAELAGRPVAAKIYHPHTATREQRTALERLVQHGPPARCFLWPTEMVEDREAKTYGYVMELREQRFRALEDFMARRITPSFRALLTAAGQLSDGFLRLHGAGLCYRDISFANVFFDPQVGDVRICDNDNVDVSGAELGGVLGTQRFMAPEVVRRETVPSDTTDRYSLAVLLFYLLMGGHPLDGEREAKIRCLDVPALERLYGTDPLYVFDPQDRSNRPVRGIHDNPLAFHPLYPPPLRALFERSFTDGLRYPTRRVRESEWRKAFASAVDGLLPCGVCHAENFYESGATPAGGAATCWSCRRPLGQPTRLHVGEHAVVLSRDAKLFAHHLDGSFGDEPHLVAEVVAHPSAPSVLGLKNLTAEPWTLTRPDGTIADVPPGRSATIAAGNKINFGPATGEIRG